MITKEFEFESRTMFGPPPDEYALQFDVTLDIYCTGEGDYGYENVQVWTKFDPPEEVNLNAMSEADQRAIEAQCEKLSYDYADEALQSWRESAADALYEAWKDRDHD